MHNGIWYLCTVQRHLGNYFSLTLIALAHTREIHFSTNFWMNQITICYIVPLDWNNDALQTSISPVIFHIHFEINSFSYSFICPSIHLFTNSSNVSTHSFIALLIYPSIWYLYIACYITYSTYIAVCIQATGDPHYLEVGKNIIEKINEHARVPCGFAALRDVRTLTHEDRWVLEAKWWNRYKLSSDTKEIPLLQKNSLHMEQCFWSPQYIKVRHN